MPSEGKKQNKVISYETILLNKEQGAATISLNRPELRNAINLQMIREITSVIELLNNDNTIRLIIFNSTGANFCSGADLNWMKEGMNQSEDQLRKESLELAKFFRTIWESSAITISAVKGFIPGGAIGILAASDFVVAEDTAVLTFSELKMGLIPATIAPYVLRKAGFSRTSDWMMTGRSIDALEARDAGLIQRICEEGLLEISTGKLREELLIKGAHALRDLKLFLRRLEGINNQDELDTFTSQIIAGLRVSSEAQEGMNAFFQKRKPDLDGGD